MSKDIKQTLPKNLFGLTKIDNVTTGKNKKKLATGFYLRKEDKAEFFVKETDNPSEAVIEALIGGILDKIKGTIIPKEHCASFICANCVKVGDGYGLIQPKRSFLELFKIMYPGSEDRSAFKDMLEGEVKYVEEVQRNGGKGLALMLVLRIAFGDNSSHGGNIVRLLDRSGKLTKELAGIDNGAGLRDYADEDNQNIFFPKEYKVSLFGHKGLTKNYIRFYLQLPGLFSSMQLWAEYLSRQLLENPLSTVIAQVLSEMPKDFLNSQQKAALGRYTKLPCENLALGEEAKGSNGNREFSEEFSRIFAIRLNKICGAKFPFPKDEKFPYPEDNLKDSELIDDYLENDQEYSLTALLQRETCQDSISVAEKIILTILGEGVSDRNEAEEEKYIIQLIKIRELGEAVKELYNMKENLRLMKDLSKNLEDAKENIVLIQSIQIKMGLRYDKLPEIFRRNPLFLLTLKQIESVNLKAYEKIQRPIEKAKKQALRERQEKQKQAQEALERPLLLLS